MKSMTRAEAALRDAVVDLAREKPVTELNVAEVCRRAGVTRDSFYRFASSPVQLLAQYLYEDHDVALVIPSHEPGSSAVRALTPATRVLIEHVIRNKDIYANAMTPRFPLEVREALLLRLESVLFAHAREFPERLPDIAGERPDQDDICALVYHASNGVVGAIEFLVSSDGLADVDRAIAVLHAATSPWWLTEN